MKTIRYYSNSAPKEALAVASWSGEKDSLPPSIEFMAEGGIIDFARVQDEQGGLAVLQCGEMGSGKTLELNKLEFQRGELVEPFRMNIGACPDISSLLTSLVKIKVKGRVNVIRGGQVIHDK